MPTVRAVLALLPLVALLLLFLCGPALPQEGTKRVYDKHGSYSGQIRDHCAID